MDNNEKQSGIKVDFFKLESRERLKEMFKNLCFSVKLGEKIIENVDLEALCYGETAHVCCGKSKTAPETVAFTHYADPVREL